MPHLNRAVNDPLIQSSGYKAYSYVNPMAREQDPGKTLDLNSLDFSLDDFQKLTKGHYNAGELRLTDSGKLDIVNHHKTWSLFNHKAIDGADSYAIRVAFAKAMAAGGLGKDAMKTVRKALGLGPGYTVGTIKALKPLTRQEVRQLIDANISTLNAGRAPDNRLKTYDQLHARYSAEEKRDIAAAREEINRTGSAGTDLNAELLDVLTVANKNPSFEGLSVAEAEDYLEFIDELSTALECLLDKDSRYDWVRENHTEYKVPVIGGPTGMALALEGGKVIFETVTDGKRSHINLGLTPDQLQDRLDQSQAQLNEIAILDVDESANAGKDAAGADAVSHKPRSRKSHPSGNIRNENGIEDNDSDLPKSKGIPSKITLDQPYRKAPVIPERIEIKEEPSPEARKRTARQNLNLLATLIAKQYDFDVDIAINILERIEGWEEQLADCGPAGHPQTLADINDDLRDFLLNNHATIQPLLDQAIRDKDA